MSFTVSNQNSGNFITALSGNYGIAATEYFLEFWAASGTAAAAGILPPFTNSTIFAGKIFTTRAENILVGAVSTPAIVLLDTGVPIWSFWGGSIPAYPAVNGFFNSNNPQNMVLYGDFDEIGHYANVGPTIPEAYRPYNVACFDADGLGGVLYDNQNRFTSSNSKGIIGGPVICAAEVSVALSDPAWVFGGSFNALEAILLTPHNIVYIYFYPIVPNIAQWAVPVGFGTDGPVYSLVYDNPNLYIGGDFQNYGAPPATAGSPYLYRYELATSVPTSLPTALVGFVLNMELSAVSATRLIVYGNPNGTGATGSRAVFIDTGTLAISASGLPPTAAVASYPLNKASRAITSATLIINPPAATTDTYDVIAIAGVIGDPIFVYIFSAAIGSWELTGSDVLNALTTNNPVCMYYDATAAPSPVLFCQADTIQYEYNQLTVFSNPGQLYYSIDSGSGFSTWTLSPTGSVPNVTFSSISLDLLSGQNGVAAGIDTTSDPVVYYTTNGGSSWSASAGLPSIATSSIHVSIFGLYALVGITSPTTVSPSFSEYIVYYSTNGGSSWLIWNISPSAIKGQAANVAVSSSSMIVVATDNETDTGPLGNTKIYSSIDNGSTFILSEHLFYVLTNSSLSSSGTNSVICGQDGGSSNGYILYSNNNGGPSTWANQTFGSPTLLGNVTKVVSIDGSVAMIGGINGTNAFIWYSNGGGLWTNSNFVLANVSSFTGISVSGNYGLASINTNTNTGYLYYSTNQGQSWINAGGGTLSATTINDVSLSGDEGVAGTSNGIYYTSTPIPLCYEANTLILILENEEEVYKKVSELKVGDLVKTYKQGYKKIKLFRSFKYKPLDINNDLNLLYKHKENGVIVTGGHSILVDELTEKEKLNNLKHYGFNQTIEDKKLLLACSSDKFEKMDDYQKEYHLYHFSLESDDPKEHFGVYITDGILSESCPEETLLKML